MPATKPARDTKKRPAPARKKRSAPRSRAVAREGRRTRMNLMVDRALLERAAKGLGTENLSDVVDAALRRMAEDDAIVAGIDAMFGAYPDIPLDDAP